MFLLLTPTKKYEKRKKERKKISFFWNIVSVFVFYLTVLRPSRLLPTLPGVGVFTFYNITCTSFIFYIFVLVFMNKLVLVKFNVLHFFIIIYISALKYRA